MRAMPSEAEQECASSHESASNAPVSSIIGQRTMEIITRRTLFTSIAALAASRLPASPLGMPIGCQTWPFRHQIGSDLDGTLRQIAGDGFKSIELCSPASYKEGF